jgi:EAL domain-containing protein (putative c-di-GMP-specific phosphodiesterase class I)
VSLSAETQQTYLVRTLIEDLLADPRQLGPDYQPIVRLADGAVVAYKATGRGRPGTALADTLSLLQSAQSLGLVERLDWAFRALAFEDFLGRPALELHLTPEPETFGTLCPPRLAAVFGRARRELRVAAELHLEAFADPARLARGVAEIRDWGWRVVVADVADDPAALAAVAGLRPDVVQLDLSRPGRTADTDHPGVRRLLAAAEAAGAELMALRVDTADLRAAAVTLGCDLARGDALGRPGELPGYAAGTDPGAR